MSATLELHAPHRRDVWLPAVTGFKPLVLKSFVVRDPERRRAAGKSLEAFKRSYYPKYRDTGFFHGPFLAILEKMMLSAGIVHKAVAAPRGIAKTRNTVLACLWAMLYRHRKYVAWICRKAEFAEKRIAQLIYEVQNNPVLHEDFPEICTPFIGMSANQVSRPLAMSSLELVLPNGAAALGFGIQGGLRGLIQANGDRPDFIGLDDVEDETTIMSETETAANRRIISHSIGGLAELGGKMATMFLCTIPKENCLGDEFTDPERTPLWNGVRFRAMLKKPARADMWEKFVEICKAGDRAA